MPFRQYFSLFVIAVVICAGLLALALEERISGDSSEVNPTTTTSDPTGTETLAGSWDTELRADGNHREFDVNPAVRKNRKLQRDVPGLSLRGTDISWPERRRA